MCYQQVGPTRSSSWSVNLANLLRPNYLVLPKQLIQDISWSYRPISHWNSFSSSWFKLETGETKRSKFQFGLSMVLNVFIFKNTSSAIVSRIYDDCDDVIY